MDLLQKILKFPLQRRFLSGLKNNCSGTIISKKLEQYGYKHTDFCLWYLVLVYMLPLYPKKEKVCIK